MSAVRFMHDLRCENLVERTLSQAKRCLRELVGIAASGRQTDLSRIVRNFADRQMSTRGARRRQTSNLERIT